MTDARFQDGAARPLRLQAFDADDLTVMSALVQDAVFTASDMRWSKRHRRLAVLINRFRWEESGAAAPERVRCLLVIDGVMSVRSQDVTPGDADTVLSALSLTFAPGSDADGRVILTLAGDGAIEATVEALEVSLRDVTRPYAAPSRRVPGHDDA